MPIVFCETKQTPVLMEFEHPPAFLSKETPEGSGKVLSNLLSNAISSPGWQVVLRVIQEFENSTSVGYRFGVQDTGIGIPESGTQSDVFQAFSQAIVDHATLGRKQV